MIKKRFIFLIIVIFFVFQITHKMYHRFDFIIEDFMKYNIVVDKDDFKFKKDLSAITTPFVKVELKESKVSKYYPKLVFSYRSD